MNTRAEKEFRARLDSIERLLMDIAASVVPAGKPVEVQPNSYAIKMIARNLVDSSTKRARQ